MKATELLDIMQENIDHVKNQNIENIKFENVEAWVNGLRELVLTQQKNTSTFEQQEQLKFQAQSSLEQYKAQSQSDLEMFKSVILSGQSALKSSILINGGASVALLAFIGHIWGRENSESLISGISNSLSLFFIGVVLSAMAFGGTYLSQANYAYNINPKRGDRFRIVTVVFVILSYVAFSLGGFMAFSTLS